MISVTRVHRVAYQLHKKGVPFLPRVIYHLMRLVYSCDIPFTVEIHPSVKFAHQALGVVIGHDAVIGANTSVLQNVTVGGRGDRCDPDGRENPVIGVGVLIGAGACVLGPINIGDYAQIGANAVVLKDVPPGRTAVGVPAVLLDSTQTTMQVGGETDD